MSVFSSLDCNFHEEFEKLVLLLTEKVLQQKLLKAFKKNFICELVCKHSCKILENKFLYI